MSSPVHWFAVVCGLTAAVIASANVRDHLPVVSNPVGTFPVQQPKSTVAPMNDVLRRNGLEPGSEKSLIVIKWLQGMHKDPAIGRAVPGGSNELGRVLSDPTRRDSLMMNGLARLSADDRLHYLKIYTRMLDELVPVNCFGLSDMGDVMDRVTLGDMEPTQITEYLGLLYKVIVSSASSAAIPTPTPHQYAMAEAVLARALVIELGGDPQNVQRYENIELHPFSATPADMCWATRVTLHAVGAMHDPYRDFILLLAITGTPQIEPIRGDKAGLRHQRPIPGNTR
ncbi:hypothetical protein [Paraburkholderia caribensis]|uniref:hypothetical protein n=1 Tax=Paraburkholderia caribensis TaxID=75105 RepID=UPI0034D3577A